MTDLLLTTAGDLVLEAGDLRLDHGIGSAVLASLYTDARATDEQLAPLGGTDPRGWWPDTEGDRWGSLLWLLRREKATGATLTRAREYVREALSWLVSEGIVQGVEVDASFVRSGEMELEVRLVRGTGSRWSHLWTDPGPLEHESGGVRVRLTWFGGGAA